MKLPIINRLFSSPVSYITFFISVLFLGGLFLISSCDDDSTLIGENLQPQNDKFSVSYYDEFPIEVYTRSLDSIRSDETSLAVAGEFADPVFGTTEADFISHVRLSDELVFDEDPVIDSLIVFLEIIDSYGDTNSIMEIKTHELKKDFYIDSVYYSNLDQENLYYEDVVGAASYSAYDTVVAIYMNNEFAEKVLADTSVLDSQEEFLQEFKGLYFTSDIISGEGVITHFNLLTFATEMSMFFHYPSTDDTLYYSFSINQSSARVNMYSHDFSTADPAYAINHLNENVEDSVSYVQGLAGAYTKVSFPTLENWRDSLPIAISKAELLFNLSTDCPNSSEFFPPDYLDIKILDENGNFESVYDLVLGRDYFGGLLTEGVYTFNISDFVHKYLTEYYVDPTFYIFINADHYRAHRAVLSGSDHTGGVEMKMTYTR